MQRVSPAKKIPAQAEGEKKKSCELKIPLPPHHFSNGPSLILNRLNSTRLRAVRSRPPSDGKIMQIAKVNEEGLGRWREKRPHFSRLARNRAIVTEGGGGGGRGGDCSHSRIPQNMLLVCKTSVQAHIQFQQFELLALAFKTL